MTRQPVTRERIVEAITPVLQQGGALKAILFGSYARGDADEYSDLDLIIIVAESQWPFVERFKDFMALWHVSPVKSLEVFVYTRNELAQMQRTGNVFLAHALEEGEVIYEAQPPRGGRKVAPAGHQ